MDQDQDDTPPSGSDERQTPSELVSALLSANKNSLERLHLLSESLSRGGVAEAGEVAQSLTLDMDQQERIISWLTASALLEPAALYPDPSWPLSPP